MSTLRFYAVLSMISKVARVDFPEASCEENDDILRIVDIQKRRLSWPPQYLHHQHCCHLHPLASLGSTAIALP